MVDPATETPFHWRLALALAGLKLLIHLLNCNTYGYFRDELYFLDCGRHLQWGYVDDAPGIAWLAKLALLLGGSLTVVRIIAALGGAATVWLTCLLARDLGGKRFAQGFAGLCVLASPIFLAMGGNLCVGAFEPLSWLGCVILALRIARTGNARLWLWFGAVAGLGLQTKYTMALVLACFLGGMLLTPMRRELRKSLFWAGAGLAFLIFLPSLVWQVRNHFPLLEAMETIRRTGKNVILGPIPFLLQQIEIVNPVLLPLWVAGLISLLRNPKLRFLGWFYLLLLWAMILLHAKNYYLAAIYPMLFAAGAVAFEQALERGTWSRDRLWPKAVSLGIVTTTLFLFAPLVLPLLPPQKLLAYPAALGLKPVRSEVDHESPLSQNLADQFGWRELAEETGRIYTGLPPAERSRTGIYAGNYGEAGAINQFGPALGLPAAICAHQAHSFWGPPAVEFDTLICLGCDREGLEKSFQSVTEVATHQSTWGMPGENRPIFLCRGIRTPLRVLWPQIKHWN